MTITIQFPMFSDEGDETIASLPAKYEICPHCKGTGTSSSYLGAFTRDDMDEAGPEFVEDYMRGDYDRACDECEGGKVKVVDHASIVTSEQKAALKYMIAVQEEMAECRAIEIAERRMGA